MDLTEKTLEQNVVFDGKIITVRKDTALLPNGKTALREVVAHNGGVCVAPLTDDNSLIFVRQFRYPYMEELLELPAGKLEKGEDPFEAGKRELEEETGRVADEYIDAGKFYPTPGYCGEIIHLYIARKLSVTQTHPDEDEFLEVTAIPIKEAVRMVMDNEIRDGKTIALVLKVARILGI